MSVVFVSGSFDLKTLIAASQGGSPATSGQSFLGNVTGAVSGAGMLDYRFTDWSVGGPQFPLDGQIYSDGATFRADITFTKGSKAANIMRAGNVLTIGKTNGQPAGFDAIKTGSSVVTSGTSTLNYKIAAPYAPNGTPLGAGWWHDDGAGNNYNTPWDAGSDTKPLHGDPTSYPVWYGAYLQLGAVSGHQLCEYQIEYQVDLGFFNGYMRESFTIDVNNRTDTLVAWEWEWHSNSSYTALVTTAQAWSVGSTSPGQSLPTYYLRGRQIGGTGVWQNVGAVSWTDTR